MRLDDLTPEQESLLATLVEARQQALPVRVEFFYGPVMTQVQHIDVWGDGAHQRIPVEHEADLLYLITVGMLHAFKHGSHGSFFFDITPDGLRYYEAMKRRAGSAARQIEADTIAFLEDAAFRVAYPGAAGKWTEAARMLWAVDSEKTLTRIGHECREALILFADELVTRFNPPDYPEHARNVVGRIRAVLESQAQDLGKTERLFLDALVSYSDAVNQLVQRQAHGAEREGEQLRWRDARRVVFQTAMVMHEVAETAARSIRGESDA